MPERVGFGKSVNMLRRSPAKSIAFSDLFLRTSSSIQTLQRIQTFAFREPTLSPLLVELSRSPDFVLSIFPYRDEAHIFRHRSLASRRQQVLWDMPEMRLLSDGMTLGVMAKVAKVLRVLLEMALELGRVDEFLAQLLGPGFPNGNARHRAESVCEAVSETFELGHVKLPFFHFAAALELSLLNLFKDLFVILALGY